MGVPTEKELKYLLCEKGYRRLLGKLGTPKKSHRFRNVFLDTQDLWLHRRKIGLRVRLDSQSAWLTLKKKPKKPSPRIKGFSIREEYEVKIPLSKGRGIARGTLPLNYCHRTLPYQKLLESLPEKKLEELAPLGEIRTIRRVYRFKSMNLEVDRCQLFDKTFFELEIETTQPVQAKGRVESLLRELQVPVQLGSQSKLERFIREWRILQH